MNKILVLRVLVVMAVLNLIQSVIVGVTIANFLFGILIIVVSLYIALKCDPNHGQESNNGTIK